jgi:hypothetical protein
MASGLTSTILVPQEFVDNSDLLEDVPDFIRKRISILRGTDKLVSRGIRFLSPIADEFDLHIETNWYRVTSFVHGAKTETAARLTVMCNYVLRHLVILLIGINYNCQVEVDIRTVVGFIDRIILACRSSEGRANLLVLKNLLLSYQRQEVNSLAYRSSLHKDHLLQFEQLLLDQEYRELSSMASLLSNPTLAANIIEQLGNRVAILSTKPAYRSIVKLTKRAINIVTRSKVFEDKSVEPLVNNECYPLIFSLTNSFHAAYECHRSLFGTGNMVQAKVGPNWQYPIRI